MESRNEKWYYVIYLLGSDVDIRSFSDGVLHDKKELGDNLDDMSCLEDEVTLLLGELALEQAASRSGRILPTPAHC